MVVRRVDPEDGCAYTYYEFSSYYEQSGLSKEDINSLWSTMKVGSFEQEQETCAGSSPRSSGEHQVTTFALSPELSSKRSGRIESRYDVDLETVLGEGSFGEVVRATDRRTGVQRAVKCVEKAFANPLRLESEIHFQEQLDHENIVKLIDVFETVDVAYLVLECCEGGDLFERLEEQQWFEEGASYKIVHQLLLAVAYLHSHELAHRDIKLDNLAFDQQSVESTVKLLDFGLAKRYDAGCSPNMWTTVGTARYVSPQVLEGAYDESCDVWSSGIVAFGLLSGCAPFGGETDEEVVAKVRAGVFTFWESDWEGVSKDAKDVVMQMLTYDARNRPCAEELLKHRWFSRNCSQFSEGHHHPRSLALNQVPSTNLIQPVQQPGLRM